MGNKEHPVSIMDNGREKDGAVHPIEVEQIEPKATGTKPNIVRVSDHESRSNSPSSNLADSKETLSISGIKTLELGDPLGVRKENTVRARILNQVMRGERGFLLAYIAKYLDKGRMHFSKQEHEDVLQELFLRLNKYINLAELQARLDNPEERKQWLVEELRQVIKQVRRRQGRSLMIADERPDVEQILPDQSFSIIDDPVLAKRLYSAALLLGETDQAVLKLMAEGYNQEEIKAQLHLSPVEVSESIEHVRAAIKDKVNVADLEFSLASPLDVAIKDLLVKKRIDQALVEEDFHKIVVAMVLNLPPFYQNLLHLFYYQRQTNKEIARIVGSHAATVQKTIGRVLNELAVEVGKQIKLQKQS